MSSPGKWSSRWTPGRAPCPGPWPAAAAGRRAGAGSPPASRCRGSGEGGCRGGARRPWAARCCVDTPQRSRDGWPCPEEGPPPRSEEDQSRDQPGPSPLGTTLMETGFYSMLTVWSSLIQAEISQQLLNVLMGMFIQTFMVPWGWLRLTVGDPLNFPLVPP